MIIQENQISCTQTSIFIQKNFTKILCIHKCTLQKEQKLEFYAFKHAFSFKSKVQIQSEISCIHKCIIQKITKNQIFMYFHMHFSKRIENQISCTQTCIIIQTRNSYSTKICMHT